MKVDGKDEEGVIVFGAGWYFSLKRDAIVKNYERIIIIDNSVTIGDERANKTYMYNPNEISCLPNYKIIIMSNIHYINMYKQLIGLGIDKSRIQFGMNEFPFVDELENTMYRNGWRIEGDAEKVYLILNQTKKEIKKSEDLKNLLLRNYNDKNIFDFVKSMPEIPISRRFGLEFGTSITRYYINKFVEENSSIIKGVVCEIGDDRYTALNSNMVNESYILHVEGKGEGNIIKLNLEIEDASKWAEKFDCIICTQTIQMIYGLKKAIENLYLMLKPGGKAIISASGISQISLADYNNWGEYWRFSDLSMKKALSSCFDKEHICVKTYGNVKSAAALLYGICAEKMESKDLDYNDKMYQVVIGAVVEK